MNELGLIDHAALPSIPNARLPMTYENAKRALTECSKMDECQDWADKMEAMASYARQSEDNTLRRMCDRIQARAIRRCGELLMEVKAARGANQNIHTGDDTKVLTRTEAATEAGLSKRQKDTALQVANIDEAEFEEAVESDEPPTISELAKRGTNKKAPVIDTSYLEDQTPDDFHQMVLLKGLCDWIIARSADIDLRAAARRLSDERRDNIGKKLGKCEVWLTSAKEVFDAL